MILDMKIGVMADTHGNMSGVLKAVEHMRTEEVTKIFHLGHNYEDVQSYINMRRQILSGTKEYDDTDFVSDFADFLIRKETGPKANRDLDEIQWLKRNIIQVPAAGEAQYEMDTINKVEFEMVAGKFVAVVHNPKDLGKEDIASANLLLYGHTHIFQVDVMQNRYFINPGHMQADDGKRPPSYAILYFADEGVEAVVYGLDRIPLLEKKLETTKKRKFSIT